MSMIDDYRKAKLIAERCRKFADGVNPGQPHDSGRYYDKFGADIKIEKSWAGAYGNSSSYSWDDFIVAAVEEQIAIELRGIVEHVALRLEAEAEKARRDAIAEAQEVLKETTT